MDIGFVGLVEEARAAHGDERLARGMDIGFVGLGNIGGPCAEHVVDAGHRVTVFAGFTASVPAAMEAP